MLTELYDLLFGDASFDKHKHPYPRNHSDHLVVTRKCDEPLLNIDTEYSGKI